MATSEGASPGRRFGQSDWDGQAALLQAIVRDSTADADTVRVLEAGCGQYPSPLGLGDNAHMVGIDVSEGQLARNTWAHEKILGDLLTYDFPEGLYDVVVCWDVLEHLPAPEVALANFVHTVRPGGVVVIKVPNLLSGKGLITKFTPHSFHIWVYKHIYGREDPEADDRPPFPTFLRRTITPTGLRRFAAQNGLVVEMLGTYEADNQQNARAKARIGGPVWRALRAVVGAITVSKVDLAATELIAVLRKPAV